MKCLSDRPNSPAHFVLKFIFSFVLHSNSMKLGKIVVRYLCVLKLLKVSLNSNEKQESFLMTHLTDGPTRPLSPGEFSLVQMNVAGFFFKKSFYKAIFKKLKNKTVISKQFCPYYFVYHNFSRNIFLYSLRFFWNMNHDTDTSSKKLLLQLDI